jgi:hypothetical protein
MLALVAIFKATCNPNPKVMWPMPGLQVAGCGGWGGAWWWDACHPVYVPRTQHAPSCQLPACKCTGPCEVTPLSSMLLCIVAAPG